MIKRHAVRFLAATLTASASLLFTACGSSTPTKPAPDRITGAQSATPTPSGTVGTVGFHLPSDVKIVIDADATGDPAKDAILRAQADTLMARRELFTDLDARSPLLARYFTGQALAFYTQQVKQSRQNDRTITGEFRYYDRKVTAPGKSLAQLTYCEDQTKAFDKNAKTGVVSTTSPSPQDYRLYTEYLEKSPLGQWRVMSFTGQSGAAACR